MRGVFLALVAAGAAVSAPVTADAATRVTAKKPVTILVTTPGHDFRPQVIRMPGGVPVRLVLRNPSGTDHDFRAPGFFAQALINDADRGLVRDGEVALPKYATVSVRLIARPGHYDLKSDKPLDVVSGMQGQILVY